LKSFEKHLIPDTTLSKKRTGRPQRQSEQQEIVMVDSRMLSWTMVRLRVGIHSC